MLHTALAGDEQVVLFELRELLEEVLDSVEVVLGGGVVCALVVLQRGVRVREADPDRGLKVQHVGLLGPGPLEGHQLGRIALVHPEWAVFVKEAVKRAAARAAVEPEHGRCGLRAVVGLDEPETNLMSRGHQKV